MVQMWKMFSPNTPSQDKIIIIEAYLTEPFTDTNIKYITKLDSNKPPIILGTSESILHYIDDLKRLKNTGKYQFIS